MARWVSFAKAKTFPTVKNKYRTIQGFTDAVRSEANIAKVWARRNPSAVAPFGDAQWQVDVFAIPRVRPLTYAGVIT